MHFNQSRSYQVRRLSGFRQTNESEIQYIARLIITADITKKDMQEMLVKNFLLLLTVKQVGENGLVSERFRQSSSLSTSGGIFKNGRASGYFLNSLQP